MESRLPADPVNAAERLTGASLSQEGAGGLVVETEACWEEGPASYRGLRTGNAALVAGAGVIYVYRSYGLFWCLSLVSQAGSAILIRVIEPTHGLA